MKRFVLLMGMLIFALSALNAQTVIRGSVYLDANQNRKKDSDEVGISDVLVSNGREVVKTDSKGNWSMVKDNEATVFVIQPAGFKVPVNQYMVPQYYSEKEKSIDFPLLKGIDNSEFEALFFGDTQARGLKEVNYVTHDVVEECIGSKAQFGVALGDIVADDPELFDEIAESIGQIGVPWYYIFGNHDHDHHAKGNDGAEDTFFKNFGPSTYAFEFGEVAFISLNDVDYKEEGGYRGNFSDDQLHFVRNYLDHVPQEKLVVLMMHIPIAACENREAMYRILEARKHTLSIAGHTHTLANVFIDESMGWKGAEPHHLFINGTVSGSWWCGLKDESGIQHATMNDGAPNGYARIFFDGNTYNIKYKAARRPADYQMNIYLPDDISLAELDTTSVLVNVFNGSEKSTVEMMLNTNDQSVGLEQLTAKDPGNWDMYKLGTYLDIESDGQALDEIFGWKMDKPRMSHHFWKAELPKDLETGTHMLTIRTTDMYGNTYQAHRIFRINP